MFISLEKKCIKAIVFCIRGLWTFLEGGEQDLSVIVDGQKKMAIISEEMLTVSQPNVSWITKLQNLSRALENKQDYKIVVTIRDPLKASFSYYVYSYEEISN